MPDWKKRKSGSVLDNTDTSRNSDRKQPDDPVDFRDVGTPVRLTKPDGKKFLDIARRQAVNQKDGKVRAEFITIVAGYVGGDGKPSYTGKAPSWPPSMTASVISAIEETVSDDEAKKFGWTE